VSNIENSDFLVRVTSAFNNLLVRGALKLESSLYDPKAFGNAAVTLVGKNFRVRLIRDRADLIARIASAADAEDWFPLAWVLSAIGVPLPPPAGLLAPEQAAELVERYLNDLERGFDQSHIEQTRKQENTIRRSFEGSSRVARPAWASAVIAQVTTRTVKTRIHSHKRKTRRTRRGRSACSAHFSCQS